MSDVHDNGKAGDSSAKRWDDVERRKMSRYLSEMAETSQSRLKSSIKPGMQSHIAKPIDVEKMLNTIAEVMKKAKAGQ